MQAGIRRAAELQLVIERVGKDAGQGLAAAIQPQERHGQVGGRVQLAAPGQERLPLSVATWSIDPFEQRQNPAPGRCRFGEDREGEITRFGRKNMGQQTAAIQSKRQGDSPARQRPPGTGLGCGHQHRRLAILPQVHLEGGWIQGDGATVVLDRNPLGGAARGANQDEEGGCKPGEGCVWAWRSHVFQTRQLMHKPSRQAEINPCNENRHRARPFPKPAERRHVAGLDH